MKRQQRSILKYTLSDRMVSLVAEITEIATHLEMRESTIDPLLRKKNRLKTIHSSLAIEHNSLSLQQVTDIIDGKRVFGPPKEIEEVKNAKAAYAVLEKVDPYSVKDLLKVHGLMVGGLTPQAGRFRTVEVGVHSGKKLVHAGLPHKMVPGKVSDKKSGKKSDKKILDHLKDYPTATLEELQGLTGLSSGGIRKAIRRLKDAKLLRRIGPDKGGH